MLSRFKKGAASSFSDGRSLNELNNRRILARLTPPRPRQDPERPVRHGVGCPVGEDCPPPQKVSNNNKVCLNVVRDQGQGHGVARASNGTQQSLCRHYSDPLRTEAALLLPEPTASSVPAGRKGGFCVCPTASPCRSRPPRAGWTPCASPSQTHSCTAWQTKRAGRRSDVEVGEK